MKTMILFQKLNPGVRHPSLVWHPEAVPLFASHSYVTDCTWVTFKKLSRLV